MLKHYKHINYGPREYQNVIFGLYKNVYCHDMFDMQIIERIF